MSSKPRGTGVALVGCGYVADFYQRSIRRHRDLTIKGVYDKDPERLARHSRHYRCRSYRDLDQLCADPDVVIVANLTNPRSHAEVTARLLEAGKHVYSEKPLAMTLEEATSLAELARSRRLQVACAPCSVLGEAAQTTWRLLRRREIGDVRLVYAELDDGPVHQHFRAWRSRSGAPWPARDEFEVGCTFEHAGYYLTWLVAFFGPVRRVRSFASIRIPHKIQEVPELRCGPDVTVAILEFDRDVVARLSCSVVAPHDHSLKLVGDRGTLAVREAWDYWSEVSLAPAGPLTLLRMLRPKVPVPLVRRAPLSTLGWWLDGHRMDFARGIADLADAVAGARAPRLSLELGVHVVEVVAAIQGCATRSTYTVKTAPAAMEPMDWAR